MTVKYELNRLLTLWSFFHHHRRAAT